MALLAGICTLIFMYAEPYYSTIAGTVAINIASVPQVVSTIKKPEHTPPGPYLLFAISALLAIIAAPAWTVGDRLFPVSAFLFCMLIFSLALRRKRKSASEIVDSVFVEIE